MTTRLAKLAAVYLLIGLVATWAVAWSSALLWTSPNARRIVHHTGRGEPYRIFRSVRCPGGVLVQYLGMTQN